MINYIEYLGVPTSIAIIIVGIFFVLQVIGEFLERIGKIVPEFMKVRKYIKRKKEEREAIKEIPGTLAGVRALLNNVEEHYSHDNITKRDTWMQGVDSNINGAYQWMQKLDEKLDKNSNDLLSLLIDNKRNYILDFTSRAVDPSYPLTKEQYNRFFTVYEEYEELIEKNQMVNGQVDVAYKVVAKSFEDRLKQHAFIEDGWHNN